VRVVAAARCLAAQDRWKPLARGEDCRATVAHQGFKAVRVDDGLPYFAEVIERDGTRMRVAPITGPRGVRTATSRDVVDHWRKVRPRRA